MMTALRVGQERDRHTHTHIQEIRGMHGERKSKGERQNVCGIHQTVKVIRAVLSDWANQH